MWRLCHLHDANCAAVADTHCRLPAEGLTPHPLESTEYFSSLSARESVREKRERESERAIARERERERARAGEQGGGGGAGGGVSRSGGRGLEEVDVADRVWARWKGGSFYAGKIKAVNADKSFAIEYDDGDFDSTVPAAHVKLAAGTQDTTPQHCWDRVQVAAAAEKPAAEKASEKVLS